MQKNSSTSKKVSCPTCQTLTVWSSQNTYRPFCSARCKLIDLGEWAAETYTIPQKHSEEEEIFSTMVQTEL